MKKTINMMAGAALCAFSSMALAQQPPHQPPMGDMGMEHGMGEMSPQMLDQHLRENQEHMLIIHDLSNKILAETDPQKRQALKDQQLELIKAHHLKMMSKRHGMPMGHKPMQ